MMAEVIHDALEKNGYVKGIVGGAKEFSPFVFDECDNRKERHVLAVPILDERYHYDCDGNAIEMNKVTLWMGLDMKAIAEKRQDCKLFIGLSEELGGGVGGTAWTDITACKPLCDAGDKLVEALEAMAPHKFFQKVGEVVDTIAYWAEANSETTVPAESLKVYILLGLVSGLAIIAGVGLAALAYVVPSGAAIVILGILATISSQAS
jgi:hypothetical protein